MSNKPENKSPVNNYFVDNYLNQLRARLEAIRNPNFKDYLFVLIYLLNVFKYILLLSVKFDYETRILLYDMSLFFGGVEKYNKIIILLINVLGLRLSIMFDFTQSKESMEWTQLFEMIRGNIPSLKLGFEPKERQVVDKFRNIALNVYKILNLSLLIYGQCNS
jgi:hypothetical protein